MRYIRFRGFTLVELLVVIAIIGVLVALLLPAIQAAREAARRTACSNNIVQLIMATHQYEGSFELLPAGVTNPTGPIRNEVSLTDPISMHHGWIIRVLPYLEEGNVYRLVDFSKSVYAPENAQARDLSLSVIMCPSDSDERRTKSNYAGCHHNVEAPIDQDNLGVLFLNSHIRIKDVPDGTSHTIFLGEKRVDQDDLGWMSGTRATLRNTGSPINIAVGSAGNRTNRWTPPAAKDTEDAAGATPTDPLLLVGGFGSPHPGGAQFAFGDGSVRFLDENIAPQVFGQMATRNGGEVIDSTDY